MSTDTYRVGRAALPVSGMSDLFQAGDMLARSGLFGIKNPATGFIVAATCAQMAITFVDFFRTYHIVDDKLAMKADAMLAEFRKKGGRYRIIENTVLTAEAEFEFEGNKLTLRYDMEDARRTGDCLKRDGSIKDTWSKRPEDMMWARLMSKAVRRLCPEINSGVYTPEEVSDFSPTEVDVSKLPRASSAPVKTEKKVVPFTHCPLNGEIEGVDVYGRPWGEFSIDALQDALNTPDDLLADGYKAEIEELIVKRKGEVTK